MESHDFRKNVLSKSLCMPGVFYVPIKPSLINQSQEEIPFPPLLSLLSHLSLKVVGTECLAACLGRVTEKENQRREYWVGEAVC